MLHSKKNVPIIALLLLTIVFAGCHEPADTAGHDADKMDDDKMKGDDKMDAPDFLPVETGSGLSAADIQSFVSLYDDQPLGDSQSPWPSHRIKWVTDDTFIFTHWNAEDPAEATELNWIGIGKKGVFCSEDRPGPEDQWRHFHQLDAPAYADGHGGEPGEAGYWLLHVAVRDFTAPWGEVGPGVDATFMHTPATDCGADYATMKAAADHSAEASGALTGDEITSFASLYDDQPLGAAQTPWPSHLIKWVTEETFIFTHWNAEDPAQATELNWIGIGKAGVFCAADRPGPEDQWRHFHQVDAPAYGDGHGGEPNEPGYWLVHVAVREFTAPWGDVAPGVDSTFMHTPAGSC